MAGGNYMNFVCNVTMWWFDGTGTWNVNASVKDINNNLAQNTTSTFQVSSTTGFNMGPNNLTYSPIAPGSTNQTPTNDPLLLNNTGNFAIVAGAISINATNLLGETTSTLGLWANNFSASWNTGGTTPIECGTTANTLINKTAVNITTANLTRGNYTINDGNTGQEQLYVCLKFAGTELQAQAYSTLSQGAWIVIV